MVFEEALKNLKEGKIARRSPWARKESYIECQRFDEESGRAPMLVIKNKSGLEVVWNPGQIDLFAEDWEVTDKPKEGTLGYAFTW